MSIDRQNYDLERNLTTLTGTLGHKIIWFVLRPLRLIFVMKLRVLVVFSSIQL